MHFYSRLSGNQKCKAFLNSNGSHRWYLQPRHLHFGRCSPLSSPPCLQSRALVIQPTHLPPVTIPRSYPWIHDQFSKKKSMQTYSIPHLQILFVPNLHLCNHNFVVANIPLTLWLLTVVSKPDQKRIKGLAVWSFTTQKNICTRKKEHTNRTNLQRAACFPTAFSA